MRFSTILAICGLISTCGVSFAQERAKAPEAVLQLLDQAAGSWYVKVGERAGACTVNKRANGRCVLVEGRKFADAISFTCLFGWYAPTQQIVGLLVFDNGESLLVRAKVDRGDGELTAQGDAVGILSRLPVKAKCKVTVGANVWSVEVENEAGETVRGLFRRTDGSR